MNTQSMTFNEFYSHLLFNLSHKVIHQEMKAAFMTTIKSLQDLNPSFEALKRSLFFLSEDDTITEIQRKTFLYMWEDLEEIKSEYEQMKNALFKFDFCQN